MVIPAIDTASPYKILPIGVHRATLDEVYSTFVENAPYRNERELIFRAMSVYLDTVAARYANTRILLNGGFVTHKEWAAPHDADLAIGLESADFKTAYHPEQLPFWTLKKLSFEEPVVGGLPRLQPMLGLVDGFAFPNKLVNHVKYWEDQWGKIKDENGDTVIGQRKGFLEVIK